MACAVHGGAGPDIDPARHLPGILAALAVCRSRLEAGDSAMDAVLQAVVLLEDDPAFNAGTGSVLTLDGTVEMDAGLALSDRRFGAVAALRDVRNPILVARDVMLHSPHSLVVGEGAEHFAREQGHQPHDPITDERRRQWMQARAEGRGPVKPPLGSEGRGGGTVGAVALDAQGQLAAATSTGGTFLQMTGRVGDSPLPGAGTWASPRSAASATGAGEQIMRMLMTRRIAELCDAHVPAPEACEVVRREALHQGVEAGLIVVDGDGEAAILFTTAAMSWATFSGGEVRHFDAVAARVG
ncbi:MAG: isoaspartyl peptidase/L-asparaginase family protein [Candidatus Dormibacteria bacterium]